MESFGLETLLIIISRSDDPSVRLITESLACEYIRINVDESETWSFLYDNGLWQIESEGLRHVLGSESRCWWWKAYFEPEDGDEYRNEEVLYIVREIYAYIARNGVIVGNPPAFHQSLGKLGILDIARQVLQTPVTQATFNSHIGGIEDAVVKSFASASFANSKVLYTTRVRLQDLNPLGNPWFAQQYIEAQSDITTYVVGKKLFHFERSRTEGKTVDWRKEQLEDRGSDSWKHVELADVEQGQIEVLTQKLGVSWGRFDLLRKENGDLVFLEFNANGQFGFLDLNDSAGLIREISKYLSAE